MITMIWKTGTGCRRPNHRRASTPVRVCNTHRLSDDKPADFCGAASRPACQDPRAGSSPDPDGRAEEDGNAHPSIHPSLKQARSHTRKWVDTRSLLPGCCFVSFHPVPNWCRRSLAHRRVAMVRAGLVHGGAERTGMPCRGVGAPGSGANRWLVRARALPPSWGPDHEGEGRGTIRPESLAGRGRARMGSAAPQEPSLSVSAPVSPCPRWPSAGRNSRG